MSINNKTILTSKFKLIDTIIHLADIHVSKNSERHNEYRDVFNTLYKKVSKESERSVIVICGDTIDNKSNLCPEQIILTKDLFYNLSEYFDIIIILGNHDLNPNNTDVNSIDAIIDRMETKNKIYLLKEPGIYEYNNILFGLTGMESEDVTVCYPEANKIRVGLYHGIIHGATNERGMELSNSGSFNSKKFKKNYDITCLGDVHKFDYLNKDKTIGYASSLIQQNIGESPDEHGYIRWDLNTIKPKFIKIPNDYKMVRVEVDNNKKGIIPDIEITKNTLFHIYYSDLTLQEANNIGTRLQKKYYNNKYILHCERMTNSTKIELGKKDKMAIQNITTTKEVENIIIKYSHDNKKYAKIKKKDKAAYELEVADTVSSAFSNIDMSLKRFRLIDLKFDNFFLYGKGNHIHYDSLEGIIGIVAPSYCGKSTTIDALLYSIFGRCTRGNVADTININETDMKTCVKFMLNDNEIKITRNRSGKRKINAKSRVHKISKELVSILINGKNESKDSAVDTNKYIEELVGSYDNFVNIIIMTQKHCENFVDLTCATRKDFLCKTMHLDILTAVGSISKKRLAVANKQLKVVLEDLKDSDSHKDELKEKYTYLNELKVDLEDKEVIREQLFTSEVEAKVRMESLGYSDELIHKVRHRLDDKNQVETDLEILRDELETKKTEYNKLNSKLKTDCKLTKVQYKQKIDELSVNIKRLNKSLHKINYDNSDITKVNREDDILKNEIKVTVQGINELEKEKKKLSESLVDIDNKVLERLDEEKDIIKEQEMEVKRNNKKIKTNIKSLESLEDHEYDKDCKYCMTNPATKEKIRLTNELEVLETENDLIESSLKKLQSYNATHSHIYDDQITNNKLLKEIEKIDKEILNKDHNKKVVEAKLESIERKLEEITKEVKLKQENYKIEKEIESVEKQLKKLTEEFEEYQEIKEKLVNIKEDINGIESKINKLQQKLDELVNTITSGEVALENREEYEVLSTTLDEIINKKKEFSDSIIKIKDDINETNDRIVELNIAKGKYDHLIKQVEKHSIDIRVHETLTDVLNGDEGVINKILDDNILPKLTENVNNILTELGDYTIRLVRHGNGIDIIKIRGKNELNIETNSGCEEFISNIGFRMALAAMSSNIKTDMMIIDEAFRFLDDATINKMPTIINYMKNHYKYVIMISHDERIIKMYDKEYTIKRCNDKSFIDIC
jgi:DNA repair exonuclease SbcCD ATPase subunit